MRYHPYHAPVPPSQTSPLARRVFSLTGLVPLGVFLVTHLFINARVLRGDLAFATGVDAIDRVPALALIEALLVFGPLLVHGLVGLWLILSRSPLSPVSPYPPAIRVAMRTTGVVVALFLVMHLSEFRFRIAGARLDGGSLGTVLAADLSTTVWGVPWRGIAYLIGTGCAAFHFAAGCWGYFASTQPGRASPRGRRWAGWGAAVLGVTMGAAFADVVVFHATGAKMVGGEALPLGTGAPCP